MSYLSTDEAYEYNDLACWYQNSINQKQPPIWTDEHLEELLNDFYIIPKDTPAADVVPKSEVENYRKIAEHQQSVSMRRYFEIKQLKEELAKAKQDVAREIIADLVKFADDKERHFHGHSVWYIDADDVTDFITELKKKYTESEGKE